MNEFDLDMCKHGKPWLIVSSTTNHLSYPLGCIIVQYLQGFLEKLVHLGHSRCNAQVNGPVADLNDEAAANLRVDLEVHSLVTMSRLERLCVVVSICFFCPHTFGTTFNFLFAPTYWLLPTAVSSCLTTLASRVAAEVMVISTSPREALISWPNFSHTPSRTPRRLFSARVLRKLATVLDLSWVFVVF